MLLRRWPASVWTVRHGESAANVALREAIAAGTDHVHVTGRDADVPLSAMGEEQARAAGRWFRTLPPMSRPERVLCSPFRRARRTAELIVAEAGLDVDIRFDERLREKDLGSLEKLTRLGVQHRDPLQADLRRELGKFYYRPPGGESWCDVIGRVRNMLYQFVLHEDDRRVLFVCHQAVITCMRYVFEHLDEEGVLRIDRDGGAGNCAISEYAIADEAGRPRMRLVHWNCDPTDSARLGREETGHPNVGGVAHGSETPSRTEASPREGLIDLWGEPIEVAIGSAETNNASCTLIQTSPPGGGTLVHTHTREDEVLVVLEGDYAFYDGQAWQEMRPGEPHYLPRGRPHAYRNIGSAPGRMMVFAAPGGLDLYFAAVAPLTLPQDQARFDEISAMYGISVPPQDSAPLPPRSTRAALRPRCTRYDGGP